MEFLRRLFGRRHVGEVQITVQVVVEPDGDRFHAFNPAFPGLHTEGGTPEAALQDFAESLPAYLESLAKHGEPIPVGCLIEEIHDERPQVPVGAFLRHVQLQWPPSHQLSGLN